MDASPYRAVDVREGVALPRRGHLAWACAGVVPPVFAAALLLWLSVVRGVGPKAPWQAAAVWAFAGAYLFLVGAFGARVVYGRSRLPALLLALAVVPVAVVEFDIGHRLLLGAFGMLQTVDRTTSETSIARNLAPIALARTVASGTSAALFLAAFLACSGAVVAIDTKRLPRTEPSRPGGRRAFAFPAISIALVVGSVVFRVRAGDRAVLLNTCSVVAVVTTALIATLLAKRVRMLATWHDADESSAASRAAIAAVVAFALAAACAERAVLACHEHGAFEALSSVSLDFHERLAHAETLARAWRPHTLAPAAALLMVVPVLAAAHSVGSMRPAADGWIALGSFALTFLGMLFAGQEVRGALITWREDVTAALPSARLASPAPPVERRVSLGAEGSPRPVVSSGSGPFALVVDRRTPTTSVLSAFVELDAKTQGAILVERATREAIARLGPASAVVGPRLSQLAVRVTDAPFRVPPHLRGLDASEEILWVHGLDSPSPVLLVMIDGDIGRLAVRRNLVRGEFISPPESFDVGTDPEASARRRALGGARASAKVIVLAPDLTRDAQALVDAIVAALDVAPGATVVVTTDRDDVEDALLASSCAELAAAPVPSVASGVIVALEAAATPRSRLGRFVVEEGLPASDPRSRDRFWSAGSYQPQLVDDAVLRDPHCSGAPVKLGPYEAGSTLTLRATQRGSFVVSYRSSTERRFQALLDAWPYAVERSTGDKDDPEIPIGAFTVRRRR